MEVSAFVLLFCCSGGGVVVREGREVLASNNYSFPLTLVPISLAYICERILWFGWGCAIVQ